MRLLMWIMPMLVQCIQSYYFSIVSYDLDAA